MASRLGVNSHNCLVTSCADKISPFLRDVVIHLVMPCLKSHPWEVYKQAFWMKKYGHKTLKRTWLWSTSEAVKLFDLGKCGPGEVCEFKTTQQWTDATGKNRFSGNGNLKKTQSFGLNLAMYDYTCREVLFCSVVLVGADRSVSQVVD